MSNEDKDKRIKELEKEMKFWHKQALDLREEFKNSGDLVTLKDKIDEYEKTIDKITKSNEYYKKKLKSNKNTQERYKNLLNSNAELIKINDGLSESYANLLDRNKELVKELSDAKSYLVDYEKKFNDFERALGNAGDKLKGFKALKLSNDKIIEERDGLKNYIVNLAINGALIPVKEAY